MQQNETANEKYDALTYALWALIAYSALFYLLPLVVSESLLSKGLPQLYFLVASWLILRKYPKAWPELGLSRTLWKSEGLFGLVVAIVPLAVIVATMLMTRTSFDLSTWNLGKDGAYFYQLFVLVIFAPLTEELFFRGVLASAMKGKISNTLIVVLVSVLFAAAHFSWGPGPFLLGIATTTMFLWRRSIIACIVLHAICNAFGPILFTFLPDVYEKLRIFFQ